MKQYDVRELLHYSREAIWKLPPGKIELRMDDGLMITTTRRTIYCHYLWEIHRQFPKMPLFQRHHLQQKPFSNKSHLQLLSNIFRDWHYTYYEPTAEHRAERERLWKMIYDITNDFYNEAVCELAPFVSTMSIIDMLEVMDDPKIREANRNVKPTQKSIDQTYEVIEDRLNNAEDLANNAIAQSVRSSMASFRQVQQCIGPRGFVTEIQSMIFKEPITVGFGHGLRRIYDSMIESRSASKALLFAKDPLSDCEYFNRKLQMVSQIVQYLEVGDCGSTHTIPWTVQSTDMNELEGVYYIDPETQKVKPFQATDHHLVGETIQIRTPFGCTLPHRQSVCEVCCGQIAYNIPQHTNLGHMAAICLCMLISQLVLSTKHVEGSSKVDDIDLGEYYSQFIVPGAENNTLRLAPGLRNSAVRLVIDAQDAQSLPDVFHIKDFSEVDTTKITEMREVRLLIGREQDHGGVYEIKVPISMGSRLGSLTARALEYISWRGVTLDDDGDYIIDLDQYDLEQTLFELPLKHINMIDYQKQVEQMLLSVDRKNRTGIVFYKDPVEAIRELMSLVNSKLSVNLSHILILCFAVSARDPDNWDYRLPRGGDNFKFLSLSQVMSYRSLSMKLAFESQEEELREPESYVIRNRPGHPMDALVSRNPQR